MSQLPRPYVKYAEGWREGRGFSLGEIKAVGLNATEARLLGISVDTRRITAWPQNIEALKKWLMEIVEGKAQVPDPVLPKAVKIKRKRGRAFRGLTAAGRKARGLLSTRFRETHNYKFRKKVKERRLKKRHEATKGLGNVLRISKIVDKEK